MKTKTMIAMLAAVAVGAAFADCGYTVKPDTAWVYKWTFTGKTTTGKALKAATTKAGADSACGYAPTSAAPSCAIRVPASLKIEGYTWACAPGCGSDGFESFAEMNEVFWQKKPFKASIAGGVSTEISHIIGKNAKQVEIAGTATFDTFINGGTLEEGVYTLTYAGIGKYDAKNGRISSVSGNFAGVLNQTPYLSSTYCGYAGFWDCSTLALVCNGPSVVFGKWSAKYQPTLSKKYLNAKGSVNGGENAVFKKAPSWANTQLNHL